MRNKISWLLTISYLSDRSHRDFQKEPKRAAGTIEGDRGTSEGTTKTVGGSEGGVESGNAFEATEETGNATEGAEEPVNAFEGAAEKVFASGVPKAIGPSQGKVNTSNQEEAIFSGATPKKKSSLKF